MKNLLKPTYTEQFAEALGNIAKEFIIIFIGIFVILAKWLYILRKWEWRLAVALFIIVNAYIGTLGSVYAPKPTYALTGYVYTQTPKTEHEQIIDYIYSVFGKDAPTAFKLLSCENHALNPNALNDNTQWGGVGRDWGVFQINDTWQKVQSKFLLNYVINIQIAHQLYIENGHRFNLWTCGKEMGI